MRRRTDRIYVMTLGPREQEALRLIEDRPGITAVELAATMGVTLGRVWQILSRLEAGRVRAQKATARDP